ncbi:MAG: MFS transporter [Halanaerobiales bacterium]
MKNGEEKVLNFGTVISLYWFSLYIYLGVLAPFISDRGANYTEIGVVLAFFGLAYLIFRLPVGFCFGYFRGVKVLLAVGLFLGMVSSFGFWYFTSPVILMIFRLLAGISAVIWLTYTGVPGYFNTRNADRVTGIINSFTRLGQISAVFIGGMVASFFGRGAPFLIAAVGGASALVLVLRNRERTPARYRVVKLSELVSLLNKRGSVLIISLLAAVYQFVIFSTTFGFVPLYASEIGAGNFQLGLLMTLTILATIVGSILCGVYFVRLLGEKKMVVTGFVILTIACSLIPFIGSVFWLYIIQIISGIGQGFVFSLLIDMSVRNISRSNRGLVSGVFQMVYGLGMFAGPLVVGIMADLAGLSIGFWLVGGASLVGAVFSGAVIGEELFSLSLKEKIVNKLG